LEDYAYVVRIRGGWNWLRIVPRDRFGTNCVEHSCFGTWVLFCWTLQLLL